MKPFTCHARLALPLCGALFVLAGFAFAFDYDYKAGSVGPSETNFAPSSNVGGVATTGTPVIGEDAVGGGNPPEEITVTVFVVWGSSNACGPGDPGVGDEEESPNPNANEDGTAWEWHHADPAVGVEPLLDPFPCFQMEEEDDCEERETPDYGCGSAWPQFAITYSNHTGGVPAGHVLFMSSSAEGGSRLVHSDGNPEDWHPTSGEIYPSAKGIIQNAMLEAEAYFTDTQTETYEIVFGGVLWIQGNDLRDALSPWPEYHAALYDLLEAYGEDVVAVGGGGFYSVNSNIPKNEALDDVFDEVSYYSDFEADVCSEFDFCAIVQESRYIKRRQEDCWEDDDPPDLNCGGWYTGIGLGGDNPVHWGQTALNHLGAKAGEVAYSHAHEDPFPWEVGIEVPQALNHADPADYQDVLLKVYDSDGDLVESFEIDSTIANPDWRADFNGDDPDANWQGEWGIGDLDTEFLTFEFALEDAPTVPIARYVYVPAALAYDTGVTNFFRPEPETDTGPATVRFEVFADGEVKAGPGHGHGPVHARVGPFFEDVLPGLYVMPYNHETYCDTDCPALPPGYFVARLDPDDEVPDAAEWRFRFADDDVTIPDTWAPLTWDVSNLVTEFVLEFPAGRKLVVEGALEVTGVTLTEAVGGQGWGGLLFEEGSEGTLTGVTVEEVGGRRRRPVMRPWRSTAPRSGSAGVQSRTGRTCTGCGPPASVPTS
jgi:hypothetical protein